MKEIGVEFVRVQTPDDCYWIGRYPVTNEQYRQFVDDVSYPHPEHWKDGKIPVGKEDHPVVYVSWHDARAYCQWASEATGMDIRLPTEAEWERAARGVDDRQYPWGDEFDASLCNSYENGFMATTPVGRYSPEGDSPYGCADMAGNVWEWCSDRYEIGSNDRVLRGGAFFDSVRLVRCACRYRDYPHGRCRDSGFRVAVPSRCPCLPCDPPLAPRADYRRHVAEECAKMCESLRDEHNSAGNSWKDLELFDEAAAAIRERFGGEDEKK